MNAADLTLEAQIEFAAMRLATVETPTERRRVWDELRDLVLRRSAERVAEMERERGLLS